MELRLLPLTVAGVICFVIAVSSGSAAWYLIGSKSPLNKKAADKRIVVMPASPPVAEPPAQNFSKIENVEFAPAGELVVNGGEIILGGGETSLPLRREFVDSFAIAETEVTVAQYREFLRATASPQLKDLAAKKDNEPVVNVSWQDAKNYCDWLAKKIGAEVRLPTEAEWERAARGNENFVYPWGNEWRNEAALTNNANGIREVKSFSANKSPFGAFDMAGNVWEWVADEERDESGQAKRYDGPNKDYKNSILRIAKGGAAVENKENLTANGRISLPQNARLPIVGFRYVIIRN